jgi:MFS family permease
MFPQLGPPIGFLLANGLFLLLDLTLGAQKFVAWGWRIPFLLSSVLVIVGLYVRLQLTETPEFARLAASARRVQLPLAGLVSRHWRPLILGSFAMVAAYATFYISTAFATSYVTHGHAISHDTFLTLLCIAIFAMAATSPIAAMLADRFGCRAVLLAACLLAALAGFTTQPLLGSGDVAKTLLFLLIQLGLMGFLFTPMGLLLPSIFPVEVRYTGAATSYSLGGIIGASFAPYIAQRLLLHGGLSWVGFYLTLAALITVVALLALGRGELEGETGQVAEAQP